MRKQLPVIILITLTIILFNSIVTFKDSISETTNTYQQKNNYPSEWFDYQRTYPEGKINQKNYLAAMKEIRQQNKSTNNIIWEFAGPTNIGGRISDIEIHPNSPSTIYVGAASGGILKSIDDGANWTNIFTNIPTIGIGDIAIDPNNENIIYAGTGESNSSSNTFLGSGIYKSDNAGSTWNYIGLDFSAYIGRVIVDYNNSSRIYVAACGNLFTKNPDRGIYRTIDGGINWEKILYLTDSTSGVDIVQHPNNPDTLYAAMWERFRGKEYRRSFGNSSGIWKTVDGGNNWNELTNGLPTGSDVGRIGISISESNPNVLYAIYDKSNYQSEIYKTTNGGLIWTQTNDSILSSINASFGWYFGQIRVDPTNENRVFALGQKFFKTEDGNNWTENGDMHVDHHALKFIDNKAWCGNDGGLYYTNNNGNNWYKQNNIPLTQFYDIALDSTNINRLYGGTQDNNSIRTATGNIDDWEGILGGDGMYCLVDYNNPNTVYCEYQWGGMYRIDNNISDWTNININDSRTNWSTPYMLHPTNSNTLYAGTYRIHKSIDRGDNWTSISSDLTKGGTNSFHTITSIDISKINSNIILSGSADGKVYITTNDGGNWFDISSGLPDRWITRVKTDPFNINTIYATVSGFRWDEHYSHIYKSVNLGQTWLAIDGNLPEVPVNTIILDPNVQNQIFVGTDAGVYMTDNGGISWDFISNSIPNVPVMAMEFHTVSRKLYIGTYGLSAYKAEIPIITDANTKTKIPNLTIYPNPVKSGNNINIHINTFSKNTNLKVYNILGKIVFDSSIYLNANNIYKWRSTDQSGRVLPKGVYSCVININNTELTKKVIIM